MSSTSKARRVDRADVEAAFSACNENDPAFINISDIKLVMRALGFEPRNAEIEKMQRTLKECAFRLFDKEEKGWISLENLRTVARELGEKMGDDELMEMLKEAAAGDGKVTEDNFFAVMKKTCLY